MTISNAHLELLAAGAIDERTALDAGVQTIKSPDELPDDLATWRKRPGITPGLLFTFTGPTGTTSVQYRPDKPVELPAEDRPRKYLFPAGAKPVANVHPAMRDRLDRPGVILVVEGTKQTLAAVAAAPDGVLVVGIAGCQGWRSDGVPLDDFNHLPISGSDVVVAFDADIRTNRNVFDAGAALAEHLELLGAKNVRFLSTPAGAKAGLDDYLASIAPERRRDVLGRLIDAAGALGKPPAKKRQKAAQEPGAEFFNQSGLMAVTVTDEVRRRGRFALAPDGSIWTYNPDTGLYEDDENKLVRIARGALHDRYRPMHLRTIAELLAADLAGDNRFLPEHPIGKLIAVTNGMLDPRTGNLSPHGPEFFAYAGLTVPWDPDATCPTFDDWLVTVAGSQAEDLLEAVALAFDPTACQAKTPFLIGPTRSGKGTFIRVIEALIPERYRAAETLHSLSTNRFAVAQLHGKIINSAGDLSDHHLDDLSQFKMATGGDSLTGERKFRDAFTFRNRAMFIFSANTPPTVSETSRAYLARIRPYLFPHSYEGAEDPEIEKAILDELPGVLVRLVEALERWHARGGYAPINPIVADVFARASDPVALFLADAVEPAKDGFVSTADLWGTYRDWAAAAARGTIGKHKFLDRVDVTLGSRTRRSNSDRRRGWTGWRILDEIEHGAAGSLYADAAPAIEPKPIAEKQGFLDESTTEAPNPSTNPTFLPPSPHEAMTQGESENPVKANSDETGISGRPTGDLFTPADDDLCIDCHIEPAGSFSGGRCPTCASLAARDQ